MSSTAHHDQPTFEGRPLARPEDDLEDQGAGFDAATLVTRRRVLSVVGVGVGAAALAACGTDATTSTSSSSSTSSADNGSATSGGASADSGTATSDGSTAAGTLEEIPEETNGPYPADGTQDVNVLTESGIVRQDITTSLDGGSSVDGVALTMTFLVHDMVNDQPFEGVAVYAWQCDAEGRYSMYTQGVEDETWLRGIQVADSDGMVSFSTIVPGCYSGRWPHIHFEVYPDVDSATDVGNVIATSQVAFPEDILTEIYTRSEYAGSAENMAAVGSVEQDMIFADSLDQQMPTISGDVDSGYIATLTVNVDTTTEATGAGGGPGGGAGGPGGGGQPPSGGGPGGEPPSGEPPTN
ncbi:intradiol ring-cleavage dioxygenase [Ornithinicoccus hortensis]|uniref:Dioxygenase-like protein n=1 Tax=Ornithinicoccus hortensis TaxID=82346 RepID=A0A542YLM2_9MICO|nr:intradiol ring-cleavage dioxygenase [Ornithinicoccus hortensis]TQL48997.1 dioxygenase-like protein [Ornithinicoccus hortensis]